MKSLFSLALVVAAVTTMSRTTSAASLRGGTDSDYSRQSIRNVDAVLLDTVPVLDLSCSEDPATCDRKSYYQYHWEDLCPYLQDVAKEYLFFNESTWEQGQWSPLYDKGWEDLTEEQRRANTLFCWGEDTWCSNDPETCEPDSYDNFWWDDLCPHWQEEATVLGYTEEIWNWDLHVRAQDYEWDDLPQSPQNMTKAAMAFCHDKKSWNEA